MALIQKLRKTSVDKTPKADNTFTSCVTQDRKMAAAGRERLMPCPSCRVGGSWRSNRCVCSRRQLLPLVLASLCSLPSSAHSFDLPLSLASSTHLHKPLAKGGALGHACSWMVGSLLRTSRIGMGGAVSRPMVACRQEEEGGSASDPGQASSRRTPGGDAALDTDGRAWERLIPGGSSVLILGDANLSFSLALLRMLQQVGRTITLTATTYESEKVVLDRYKSREVIQNLRALGATVMHGIDATNVGGHFGGDFEADVILFNFPHTGGKSKIHTNRALLRDFFSSSQPHLAKGGRIAVSLCRGQGGSPPDEKRVWGDTWQIIPMAAHGQMVLVSLYPWVSPPGYVQSGYRDTDGEFRLRGGLTHVFAHESEEDITSLHHPSWTHDVSMWMPAGLTDDDVAALWGMDELVESVERFDSFMRKDAKIVDESIPAEYEESRSYRVLYRSRSKAVSFELSRDRQLEIRERAREELRVIFR